ncbi:hypothetical protein REPUB_Repub20aG0012400 [Reevesia pubescens]
MAGALIEMALSKIASIFEEKINLAWDFKDELNNLRKSLILTRAFLQDAEMRQVDEPVKLWLKELRDIADEADVVLDELAYEDLRAQKRTKVSNLLSLSKYNMAKEVKTINLSLDKIIDRASKLGLQQRVQNAAPVLSGVRGTHSLFGDSSRVVGREADVLKIVDLLIGSNTQQIFSIVSIVGMGGLGKTTLARSVIKNEKIKNYFNETIWVCVAENFDVERILQEMFESLTGETCNKINENAIKKIQNKLEEKTYLLVLDDVWDEDFKNWEDLRGSLFGVNENKRSRSSILVTTRNENVAVVKETPLPNRHHLTKLIDDECWSIIKERAFQNSSISPELENIGRDIARNCGGVPLVATVIGGTMCFQRDIEEWVSVRDSSLWGSLEKNEGIVRVLKLSFYRLPSPSLKLCFAYCSIFPKDFNIQKEQLIQLWMAEGFLQQPEGSSSAAFEDVGDKYFNYLLSNSLLQDVERDESGCITCKMHDLVHDLAQSISKADIGVKLRHSLFLKTDDFHIVEKSKGLRVLNFCGAEMNTLPDSIGRLKHLRYLDISGTAISRLPKSITHLYHLQTLRLLRCNSLEKLPNGMKYLVSLRHLYIDDARHVPGEIGCLTSLQTLPIFDVDPERRRGIGELGYLSELKGELNIYNLQNVRNKEESRGAKLWEKKKLDKLGYRWSSGREDCSNDEEVLEGLEPHSNLKSLSIKSYKGGCYPSWLVRTSSVSGPSAFQSLTNLVELKLSDCKNLPTCLGQHPKLKFLEIKGFKNVRCIGNEFYVDGDGNRCDDENKAIPSLFPLLEKFRLEDMEELEEWLVEVEPTILVFSSLKELKIVGCKKLSRVPMMMSRFSSLEILYIESCNELSWTEEEDEVFPSTLKKLTIKKCPNLRCIPSIEGGDISSLQQLSVTCCENLCKIGEGLLALSTCLREVSIWNCPNLKSIPLKGGSQSLKNLTLILCKELREIEGGLSASTKLERLAIYNCPNMTSIPLKGGSQSLKNLTLRCCEELREIEGGLSTSIKLETLVIESCPNLKSIPLNGGSQSLKNLSLRKCKELREIEGGLSPSTKLETLVIESCPNLKSIPLKGGSQSLKNLKLRWCEELREIEGGLSASTKLEILEIDNCPNMTSIPLKGGSQSLKNLTLRCCKELREIEGGQSTSTKLETLVIESCPNLKSIPLNGGSQSLKNLSLRKCKELREIEGGLSTSTKLETLVIKSCPNLKSIPLNGGSQSLKNLSLRKCKELREIEGGLSPSTKLETLVIESCPNLKSIPLKGGSQSLKNLTLRWCEELREIEGGLSASTKLEILEIECCPNLKSIPLKGGSQSLKNLTLRWCEELREIEGGQSTSTKLETLVIESCPNLKSIPLNGGSQSLKHLSLRWCKELREIEGGQSTSTKLETLVIESCPNLKSIPLKGGSQSLKILTLRGCKELREKGGLSTSTKLERLEICNCPNLTSIPSLDGFSSLLSLELKGCEKLTSLPSGLPTCTSLQHLAIRNCTNLNLESIRLDYLPRLKTLKLEDIIIIKFSNYPTSRQTHFFNYKILYGFSSRLKYLEVGPFSEELDEFPVLTSIHNLSSSLKLESEASKRRYHHHHQIHQLSNQPSHPLFQLQNNISSSSPYSPIVQAAI